MSQSFRRLTVTVLIALVAGFVGSALFSATGWADSRTRSYLLANPDILPQMAQAYERQRASERLAEVGEAVTEPFPGAVLGNPDGAVTLVEFSDYACGYCRVSVEHVNALIEANPDLRVVIREWPIFQGSEYAAGIALGAAKQGKYEAFHKALYARGAPTEASIAAAAEEAGIDLEAAKTFASSPEAAAELAKNMALAQQLGFTGTPSWVVGDQAFEGAVGQEALARAIEQARAS